MCCFFECLYLILFPPPLSLSMYLCIYVSMYLCIYVSIYLSIYLSMYVCMYVSMYVCMYVCIYIYMYLLLFGFLCFLQFPFVHLHVPPCSSSQAWQTTSLAPGLYLHGGAWMDGTWEPFSMTRCISYTWGLWGISMQVRWDIGSEMVTMGMGRCLKSWGPFPKTSKINPAEKGPLVRFNVIIFGWVPLFIFIWEALQIDVWWDLQNNMCVGWCLLLWHPTLYIFFLKWANPLGKPPNYESMFRTSACLFPNSQSPRIILTCKTFTLANTGLEKPNQYPEIGSAFKAAFMKGAMWFFTKIAIELAEANPDDTHWNSDTHRSWRFRF